MWETTTKDDTLKAIVKIIRMIQQSMLDDFLWFNLRVFDEMKGETSRQKQAYLLQKQEHRNFWKDLCFQEFSLKTGGRIFCVKLPNHDVMTRTHP